MILPRQYLAAGSATPVVISHHNASTTSSLLSTPVATTPFAPSSGSGSDLGSPENWSSLIGIITAIVGNILISFALNMQRYAHIRLEREWQEKERQRKRRSRSRTATGGARAKYHPPRHAEYTVEDERENVGEGYLATEADPLLGGNDTRAASSSRERTGTGGRSKDGAAVEEDTGEPAYKQKSYLKSPYWWAGIIMMTTGEAGNFLAYGFAPASIVSPLGVVALISNCIIAPFMLKEPFRKRDGLGVLVAVAGAVTVVASASDNNPKLGPDEIWDLIRRWEFETYLGITVAVIAVLIVASNRFGEKNILIDLGLVGLFGGYTALSTKGVASMLSYTLWRAITFPVTYLLVAILVFTAVMQIKYVNRALQRFDATQVIPVQFVLFTLSVILGSAILYRDFERTSGDDGGKFVGGCVMTFLGVWLITSGRANRHNDDDREPEPEDAIHLAGERYQDEVDGEEGETGTSSRRSSTVRAASPPVDIAGSLPSHGSSRNNSVSNQANLHFTPATPSPATPPSQANNPWASQRTPSPKSSRSRLPPAASLSRQSTLSTPVLPSEATIPAPLTSTSNPDLPTNLNPLPPPPHTPVRGTSDPNFSPANITPRLRRLETAERLLTASPSSASATGPRNSIPGPLLASPLSTSLATMVRSGSVRGLPPSGDAMRRRESVLGIGAAEVDEDVIGEDVESRRRTGTGDVPSQVIAGDGDGAGAGMSTTASNRKRSLSGTLGDLWRGIRGAEERGSGNNGDVIEEDGDEQRRRGPSETSR